MGIVEHVHNTHITHSNFCFAIQQHMPASLYRSVSSAQRRPLALHPEKRKTKTLNGPHRSCSDRTGRLISAVCFPPLQKDWPCRYLLGKAETTRL